MTNIYFMTLGLGCYCLGSKGVTNCKNCMIFSNWTFSNRSSPMLLRWMEKKETLYALSSTCSQLKVGRVGKRCRPSLNPSSNYPQNKHCPWALRPHQMTSQLQILQLELRKQPWQCWLQNPPILKGRSWSLTPKSCTHMARCIFLSTD